MAGSVITPIVFHDDFIGALAKLFEDGAKGLKAALDKALVEVTLA